MTDAPAAPLPAPGFARRLAVLFYDLLLLAAVLFIAEIPATLLLGEVLPPSHPLHRLYLLAVAFLYYGYHWTHGGRTLGLRTWKCRVVSDAGGPLGWRQSGIRFLVALLSTLCLGAGFLWVFKDPERRTWHDLASKSRVVLSG